MYHFIFFFICGLFLIAETASAQVEHQLIPYRDGNLWGFADRDLNIVIQPQFDAAQLFYYNLAAVKKAGKMGYVDTTGTVAVPLKYDRAGNIMDGFAIVEAGKKWGFINFKGEEVVSLKYDGLGQFYDDMAIASIGRNWGFVNKHGVETVPLIYEAASNFNKGGIQASAPKSGHVQSYILITEVCYPFHYLMTNIFFQNQSHIFFFYFYPGDIAVMPQAELSQSQTM